LHVCFVGLIKLGRGRKSCCCPVECVLRKRWLAVVVGKMFLKLKHDEKSAPLPVPLYPFCRLLE